MHDSTNSCKGEKLFEGNMSSVLLISTSLVQAKSHKSQTQKIELTPWDLQFLLVDSIQKGLLFHKPKQDPKSEQQNTFITHLIASLSRTLDFFPALAGRLAATEHGSDTISFSIDCNNAGAQFVHAKADGITIADIINPIYVPAIVHSFFPLNEVKNHEGVSKPLLGVQVTELEDSVFIGCTINHMVVDGTSFWNFFNSWSEISRGFDQISKIPCLERWFIDPKNCPIHIPLSDLKQALDEVFVLPPLKERVFHFTKENIAKLKAKANSEMSTNKISSLQAVLSHLWRSVIRNKSLINLDKEIHYRLLIGVRPRLKPPLPEQYFGGAVQAGSVTLKAKDVTGRGLGHVSWEMNKMVALHTEEKLKDFYKCWIKKPRLLSIRDVASDALVTSSSPRFDVHGNDFGWGKPIAVRSGAGNKSDGKITVFAGLEQGSIDIEACLSPETLKGMANDAEFMELVN